MFVNSFPSNSLGLYTVAACHTLIEVVRICLQSLNIHKVHDRLVFASTYILPSNHHAAAAEPVCKSLPYINPDRIAEMACTSINPGLQIIPGSINDQTNAETSSTLPFCLDLFPSNKIFTDWIRFLDPSLHLIKTNLTSTISICFICLSFHRFKQFQLSCVSCCSFWRGFNTIYFVLMWCPNALYAVSSSIFFCHCTNVSSVWSYLRFNRSFLHPGASIPH